jgi:uncharacterized membrane protein YgaE (UPF0421/DUF939 family)
MALATVVSVMAARVCGLPEQFWAVVTTVLVMQSSLGAAWEVSLQRLVGTVIGGATGAIWVTWFTRSVPVLALGMLVMGTICGLLRQSQSAYRFAGITLVIIAMPSYSNPSWIIALHRFLEVCIGIIVGMGVLALSSPWRNPPFRQTAESLAAGAQLDRPGDGTPPIARAAFQGDSTRRP